MAKINNPLSGMSLDSLTEAAVDKQLGKKTGAGSRTTKVQSTEKTKEGKEGAVSSTKTNVSIQIHVDLRKRLKRMCLDEEIGMQAFVEQLINDALSKKGY